MIIAIRGKKGSGKSSRPTEFRGCLWDDGWEFDAPCVIYSPWEYRRVGIGGNNGHLDEMVEDICSDIIELAGPEGCQRVTDDEMSWRGWGRRFDRRRRAEHVIFCVEWDGDDYEIVERTETIGPPPGRRGGGAMSERTALATALTATRTVDERAGTP